jgi:hypothetical protein
MDALGLVAPCENTVKNPPEVGLLTVTLSTAAVALAEIVFRWSQGH